MQIQKMSAFYFHGEACSYCKTDTSLLSTSCRYNKTILTVKLLPYFKKKPRTSVGKKEKIALEK